MRNTLTCMGETMRKSIRSLLGFTLLLSMAAGALAEVRVQDVARLQGQRSNRLMGYGLVVGLPGTGDGDKYAATMRALARLHERYHAPVLSDDDLKGNQSVAIVTVEAVIPEFGAREGQAIDVVVSSIGSADSLAGGQLLTTPLQYSMFDPDDATTQVIMALAAGRVFTPDAQSPTRGLVRGGAVLERDFYYSFIESGAITLVLNDSHAGWNWAHMVARAINHELAMPDMEAMTGGESEEGEHSTLDRDMAIALGPKNVRVMIPPYELHNPANYISRVIEAPLFMLPAQQARVTINRTTKNVSFTGAVTVSPTMLQIPGVGSVFIGKQRQGDEGETIGVEPVQFNELLNTLSAIKVSSDQLIDAIEHLHQSGTLHAQLRYE